MNKKLTKVVRAILVTIVATVLGFTTIIANSFIPNVVNAEGEPVSINSELVLNDDPYEATVSIKAEAQEGYSIKSITFNGETKEGQENSFSVTANGEYKAIVAYVEGTQEATTEVSPEISPEVTPENTVEETPAEQDTIDEDFGVDVQSSDEVNEQAPEVSEDTVSPEDNIEEVPESATGFFTVVNAEETILTEETTIEVNGIEEEGTFISEEAPSTEFEAQVINEESEETAVLVVKNEEKSTEYGFDVYNYYDQAIDDGLFAWGYTVGQKEQYTGWYILNPNTQEWVFNNYSFISEIEIPAAPTANGLTWNIVTATNDGNNTNNAGSAPADWSSDGLPIWQDTKNTNNVFEVHLNYDGGTVGKTKTFEMEIPEGFRLVSFSGAPANAIANKIVAETTMTDTTQQVLNAATITWTPNIVNGVFKANNGASFTNPELNSGIVRYEFSDLASGAGEIVLYFTFIKELETKLGRTPVTNIITSTSNLGDITDIDNNDEVFEFVATSTIDSVSETKKFAASYKSGSFGYIGMDSSEQGINLFYTDVKYTTGVYASTVDNATGGNIRSQWYSLHSGYGPLVTNRNNSYNAYLSEVVSRMYLPTGVITEAFPTDLYRDTYTFDDSNYNIATGGYIEFTYTNVWLLNNSIFSPTYYITFSSDYYDKDAVDLGDPYVVGGQMPTTTNKSSMAYLGKVETYIKMAGESNYVYLERWGNSSRAKINFEQKTNYDLGILPDGVINLNANNDYTGIQSLAIITYDTSGLLASPTNVPYLIQFGNDLQVIKHYPIGKFTGTYYTNDHPEGISVTDVTEIQVDLGSGDFITKIDGVIASIPTGHPMKTYDNRLYGSGRVLGRINQNPVDMSITLNNFITDSVKLMSNNAADYGCSITSSSADDSVGPGNTIRFSGAVKDYADSVTINGTETYTSINSYKDPTIFVVVPDDFDLVSFDVHYLNDASTNLLDFATRTSFTATDGTQGYKYTFPSGLITANFTNTGIGNYGLGFDLALHLSEESSYAGTPFNLRDILFIDYGSGINMVTTQTSILGTEGTSTNGKYKTCSLQFNAKQAQEIQVSAGIKSQGESSYYNYDGTEGSIALVAPNTIADIDIYYNNRSSSNFDKFIIYSAVPKESSTGKVNFNNADLTNPYTLNVIDQELEPDEWSGSIKSGTMQASGFTVEYGSGCTITAETPSDLNINQHDPATCTSWLSTSSSSTQMIRFTYNGAITPGTSGHIKYSLDVDANDAMSGDEDFMRIMSQQAINASDSLANKVGGIMAARVAKGEMNGFVFIDKNTNGIYDSGDELANGTNITDNELTIEISGNGHSYDIGSTTYNSWKKGLLDNVQYTVKASNLTVLNGYTGSTIYHFTSANQGTDDTIDSDVTQGVGGTYASVALNPVSEEDNYCAISGNSCSSTRDGSGDEIKAPNRNIGIGLVANIPATFTVDSYGTGKGLTLSSTAGNAWPSEALASSAVPTLSPTTSNYTIAKWNIYLNGSTTPVSNENNPTTYVIPAGTTAVKYEAVVEPATFTIAYHMGTGETNPTTNPTTYSYGTAIASTSFADATKTGYTFNGWYTDSNLTASFTGITATTSGRIDLYPKFTINSHSITYSSTIPSGCTATVPSQETNVMYDASKTVSAALSCTGYTFNGWTTTNATVTSGAFNMPDNDVTFTGTWAPKTDTAYTVEHYKQNLDGTYPTTASATEAKTGTTAGTADATPKTYTGYTNNASLTTYEDSVNTTPQAGALTITADGSLVVKLYYARNTHNITYSSTIPSGCSATVPSQETNVIYDASKTVSAALSCTGYTFNGWTTTNATVTSGAFNMPDNDVTFTGTWSSIATPTPGRTCQDDGYPAGWYWNGSSCVAPGGTVTSTPSSIPTSTPIVTTRPSSSPSTSANPSSSPAINSSSTPSANPSAQTTSGPNSSSSPTTTIVATITPDPSSSPITPVIGGTVIVDGKEYTIVGQNEDGLWIMEDAVGNNYILDHPEYGAENNHWALINLIAAIATLLLAIIHLVKKSTKDEDQEDEEGNPILDENGEVKTTVYKRNKLFKVVTCVMGVAAVIAFILTENLRTPMVLTDKWSLLMIVLMIVGVLSFILGNRWKENDDEDQKVQD